MKLCGVCILTDNVPRLVDFYKLVLQCEGEGDDIHTSFNDAQLAIWNPGNITLSEHKNISLMYFIDDADEEYNRLQNLSINIKFQSEPEEKPWGVKAFAFFDPDGNEVNFLAPLKR